MSARQLFVAVGVALALLIVPSAVADPPTLSGVPSSFTAFVDGSGPYPVSFATPTANDTENGSVPVTCDHNSGSDFPYGATLVTCSATDPSDLTTGSDSFTVTVSDVTAPSFSGVGAVTKEVVGKPSSTAVTYNVTQNDGGTVSAANCSPVSGSGFAYGSTPVSCTATDSHGNTNSAGFTVTVQDTIAPTFSPALAPITKTVDGSASHAVTYSVTATESAPVTCSPASGFSFAYGTTPVNCTATDVAGNTRSGSFNVTVQDTTAPTLTLPANITQTVNGVASAPVSYTATAADGAGGTQVAITPVCSPASGASFPLGTTTVNCTATDAASNVKSGSFTVKIQDTTPPTITVPASFTVNINNATTANVTYTATAADGPTALAPSCSPASGASFPLGVTTVTCNASDLAGNAAAPKSFTVTLVDNTPPVVAVTGGPPALTKDRTASLDFTASEGTTTCQLDSGTFTACSSPATYTGLADGSHTFTVKAVDAATNTASASRSWSVDGTPPVLSLPPTRYNEANGPSGAIASYSVSAADAGGALLPSAITCNPGTGTLFPIGETTVSCSVTDSAGNTAKGTFLVIVQDTTPPAINAPNVSFTATSADGALKSDPEVVTYLAGVSATDVVSTPTLTNNMPNVLPIGTTTVVFTAKDAAGNTAKKSATVTVLAVGQKAPPPDFTPPGEVLGAVAKPGDRLVTLTWKPPLAKDVAYVAVTEFVAGVEGGSSGGREIYKGTGTTVTAKGLVNGTAYRFLIVAYDKSGNRSKGVILLATPKAEALASPKQAAQIAKPPLLRWAPFAGATYYNVQLWRGSVKLLSTWPTVTRYQLTAKWTFSGKARKLTPGLYTWYVWPGLGPRADARYGSLLGSRTFSYVTPKPKPKKP